MAWEEAASSEVTARKPAGTVLARAQLLAAEPEPEPEPEPHALAATEWRASLRGPRLRPGRVQSGGLLQLHVVVMLLQRKRQLLLDSFR